MSNKKKLHFPNDYKVGVLGGGQLGKMLALAAGKWGLPFYVLDASKDFPAGAYSTEFTEGSFKDFDDVYNFGKDKDIVTIEIEHVNTDALFKLQKEGVQVHPNPQALNIIKDKGLQKQFYADRALPTSPFRLYANEDELKLSIKDNRLIFPFVQKTRTAGYDGRGVAVIRSEDDMDKILKGPCITEPLVDIDKEIAIVVARNASGEITTFPPVEMDFNPVANLVEYLYCPADISYNVLTKADELAREIIEAYDICGLLAVEFFLTKQGEILINEVAPRTHNSGHHTIDSCQTSQFEQQLRAILNLPLGSTTMTSPAIMVNLLGEAGHTGPAIYEGMDKCLQTEGVHVHLYGKKITKPFRKMGHATVVDTDLAKAKEKATFIKNTLRIISEE